MNVERGRTSARTGHVVEPDEVEGHEVHVVDGAGHPRRVGDGGMVVGLVSALGHPVAVGLLELLAGGVHAEVAVELRQGPDA